MEKTNGMELFKLYISLITELTSITLKDGRQIYIPTQQGRIYNFRVEDFKKKLQDGVGEELVKECLEIFKTLELIICKDKRYTNIQRINGKICRDISVDMDKYKLLKNFKWEV